MGKFKYGVGKAPYQPKYGNVKVKDASAVIELAWPVGGSLGKQKINEPKEASYKYAGLAVYDMKTTAMPNKCPGDDSRIVPGKRSDREPKDQKNGRHYHKPWPVSAKS